VESVTDIVAGSRWNRWRLVMWGTAAFLLLLPAIAMQFATGVDWNSRDFTIMGVMLVIACGSCELAARASTSGAYRLGAGMAVGTAFLTVWANLAVGMIGSEANPYNLVFAGVLGVALVGSIVARFQASGMAWAMVIAAAAQALAGSVGLSTDTRGGIFSMAFVLPWLVAAALLRKAAREQRASA
jgi:hypothetical protein